jgi:hypothetical protein
VHIFSFKFITSNGFGDKNNYSQVFIGIFFDDEEYLHVHKMLLFV